MAEEKDIEKEKVRRETMGKFFYDLAKAIFTAMVVGGIVSFFTPDANIWTVILMLLVGVFFTFLLASIGNTILKK